jgi:DNA replication and repair protein RecF
MYLNKLCLVNFKNYVEAELVFGEGVNCFVGDNGMGKTNLLDAIHYLAFCKSYFNPVDSQNISHEQGFFMLQGFFNFEDKTEEITCGVKRNQKKQFKRNKKDYERLSDHIGNFPLVMITPNDAELILGSSEFRRKFIDGIISQYDKVYLEKLIAYNHVLTQRNALLKQFQESGTFDSITLELWNDQLILYGEGIIKKRTEFLLEFIPLFNKNYAYISNSKEPVDLIYQPSVDDKDFKNALISSFPKDKILQHTSVGPHRDDLEFKISSHAVKKYHFCSP